MSYTLEVYIKFIAGHFQADESKYPAMKGMSEDAKRAFMLQHLVTHFAKTTGKIATAFESADHGGEFKVEFLKIDLAKQLINTLRMAEYIGMTEEDFVHVLEKKYSDSLSQTEK